MSLTAGQGDAVAQLRAIERVEPGALEIIAVRPPDSDDWLRIDISLDCRGVDYQLGGLKLRARERLLVLVSPGFPFEAPAVFATHGRWAGTPHVQWRLSLCLYASPAIEWQPGDGMFGLIERLWLWLGKPESTDVAGRGLKIG